MGIGAVRRAEDREKILKQLVQTPLSANVFGRTIGRCPAGSARRTYQPASYAGQRPGVSNSIGVLETKQG